MSKDVMPKINQVALSGVVAVDAVSTWCDGEPVLKVKLDTMRPYRDEDDAWQEEKSQFDLIFYGGAVELYSGKLPRGTQVFVTGWLRSFTTPVEHYCRAPGRADVVVRHIQILGENGG